MQSSLTANHLHASTGHELHFHDATKLAVPFVLVGIKIHTIFCVIRVPLFFKRLNHRYLFLDVLTCSREGNSARINIECGDVFQVLFGVALSYSFWRGVLAFSTNLHLVFSVISVANQMAYIRYVYDFLYGVACRREHASECIRKYGRTKVSNMLRAVYGRAAGIERYFACFKWRETLLISGEGVGEEYGCFNTTNDVLLFFFLTKGPHG